jgi:Ca-activated chloride channel family protein
LVAIFIVAIIAMSGLVSGSLAFSVSAQSGRRAEENRTEENRTERVGDEEIIDVRTNEVLLPVSVRDAMGRPVNGLVSDDFFIYDNGVRQRIASFNRRRVPANIILLLDASGSVFNQMRFIRDAANRFVRGLDAHDRVKVMQFADKVEVLQEWTKASEAETVEQAIKWRYHPGHRTVFFDALYAAADKEFAGTEGRRIIILLTDGIDSAERPRVTLAGAQKAIGSSEASVYVVSLTASMRRVAEQATGKGLKGMLLGSVYDPREIKRYLSTINKAEVLLEQLATDSGGRMFLPLETPDLGIAYEQIAEELRTQYIVTYSPQPKLIAGEQRRIKVLVAPGGYDIATRTGYISRP